MIICSSSPAVCLVVSKIMRIIRHRSKPAVGGMRDLLCASIILNLIAIDPCCSYTETEAQTVATCPQLDVLFPFSIVFSVNNWTMLPPEKSALFTVTKLYCLQARNFFFRFRGRQRFSNFFVKKVSQNKIRHKRNFLRKKHFMNRKLSPIFYSFGLPARFIDFRL